jgi:hypothetical protein
MSINVGTASAAATPAPAATAGTALPRGGRIISDEKTSLKALNDAAAQHIRATHCRSSKR